jgi:hypothetical protein
MANTNGFSLPNFHRYFLSNNATPKHTSALPIVTRPRSILEIFLHPDQEVELASPHRAFAEPSAAACDGSSTCEMARSNVVL